MQIYEYLCGSCGFQFEEVEKFNDPPLEKCPNCGRNSVNRQVSMSSFHLKGGGWYKDGYSGKNTESENIEKTGKEKNKDSEKETTAKDNKSSTEKSGNTANNESTFSKKSKSTGKEKAA